MERVALECGLDAAAVRERNFVPAPPADTEVSAPCCEGGRGCPSNAAAETSGGGRLQPLCCPAC